MRKFIVFNFYISSLLGRINDQRFTADSKSKCSLLGPSMAISIRESREDWASLFLRYVFTNRIFENPRSQSEKEIH